MRQFFSVLALYFTERPALYWDLRRLLFLTLPDDFTGQKLQRPHISHWAKGYGRRGSLLIFRLGFLVFSGFRWLVVQVFRRLLSVFDHFYYFELFTWVRDCSAVMGHGYVSDVCCSLLFPQYIHLIAILLLAFYWLYLLWTTVLFQLKWIQHYACTTPLLGPLGQLLQVIHHHWVIIKLL